MIVIDERANNAVQLTAYSHALLRSAPASGSG
jgi:hypothetical protein